MSYLRPLDAQLAFAAEQAERARCRRRSIGPSPRQTRLLTKARAKISPARPVIRQRIARLTRWRGPVAEHLPGAELFGRLQPPKHTGRDDYIVANLMHPNLKPDGHMA
jgi:hypothetical protein